MEKKKSKMVHSMTYGLVIGIAIIIYSLLLYITGADVYNQKSSARFLNWVSYLILLAGIIYSTVNYRDKELEGTISYSGALGYGTLIGLFSGVVTALYTIVFFKFIAPDVLEHILDTSRQAMEEQKMPEEQITKAIEITKKVMLPMMVFTIILFNTFFAFVFSLITSIFLKKEGTPFNDAMKGVN